MPPNSHSHPYETIGQPPPHVGRGWHTSETEVEKGESRVPGSGSHDGFIMARPVPASEVPKAYRVKELQQGSVHH